MAVHTQSIDPATGIVKVTIDRPPVNALDIEHVETLLAHLKGLDADPNVRGVVVTGSGSAFSAGVDTKAFAGYAEADRHRLFSVIDSMLTSMVNLSVPLGVAINGHALGGGLVIALAADVRLVADGDFRLGLTEVAAGVPYPDVPADLIRRELDPTMIRRLVIGGATITPTEAVTLRLLDEVVPGTDLHRITHERVAQLADLPTFADVKAQFRSIRAPRPG